MSTTTTTERRVVVSLTDMEARGLARLVEFGRLAVESASHSSIGPERPAAIAHARLLSAIELSGLDRSPFSPVHDVAPSCPLPGATRRPDRATRGGTRCSFRPARAALHFIANELRILAMRMQRRWLLAQQRRLLRAAR